ncbi:IclR family transcriptional regulator [Nonomuraea sp. KC401]|uniref:IclR family transcriptional regulator n=1 Tax=unclassified Nonomuraea TaxID=2593643 RepID=UPI0010FD114D|nr:MULTISPECIES: IclR family transcriptional regulator [unclassified Nonomuraea]NBE95600.1 helix-turn-helix domain-containing protein [Nonomuraea sp. K271]TLF71548.1 IclR family transcriptional regulator [Nonomuraea sp. KC401]
MADERRSVLRRALRVLETVRDAGGGLNLSGISRRSGVPLTTTHRIVAELHEWGALERDDAGGYRIGLRLWEVAAGTPRSVWLQRVALPFMLDLFETTHRGVHLAVREKDQVVFVERFLSSETATDRTWVGGRYELHSTAIGLVLLAHAPRELQEEIVTGPLTMPGWSSPITEHELRRTLAGIRRTGYATTPIRQEHRSVAAPIHGSGGTVVAALSLILPLTESYGPRLAHLQGTARGVSRALGAPQARSCSSAGVRK